jgi:hypothetical protein
MKSLGYLLFLSCFSGYAQESIPDSLSVDYPLQMHFAMPPVEEGTADSTLTVKRGLSLVLDDSDPDKIEGHYLGASLYIVNRSDDAVKLPLVDRELYICAEVLDNDVWKPITWIMSSGCVYQYTYSSKTLEKDTYCRFNVPVFKGSYKTKIRYTLYNRNKPWVSSNEITVFINKEQADYRKLTNGERRSVALPSPYSQMATTICFTLTTCRILLPSFNCLPWFTNPVYMFNYVSNMPSWFRSE